MLGFIALILTPHLDSSGFAEFVRKRWQFVIIIFIKSFNKFLLSKWIACLSLILFFSFSCDHHRHLCYPFYFIWLPHCEEAKCVEAIDYLILISSKSLARNVQLGSCDIFAKFLFSSNWRLTLEFYQPDWSHTIINKWIMNESLPQTSSHPSTRLGYFISLIRLIDRRPIFRTFVDSLEPLTFLYFKEVIFFFSPVLKSKVSSVKVT